MVREAPDVLPESVAELVLEVELVVAEEVVDDPLLPAPDDVEDEDVPEPVLDVDVPELVSDVLLKVALELVEPAFEFVPEADDELVSDEDPDVVEEALDEALEGGPDDVEDDDVPEELGDEVVDGLLDGGPVLEDEPVPDGLELDVIEEPL